MFHVIVNIIKEQLLSFGFIPFLSAFVIELNGKTPVVIELKVYHWVYYTVKLNGCLTPDILEAWHLSLTTNKPL